jgi:hypothetical protein
LKAYFFFEYYESAKFGPLDYWRKNAFRFKTLSRVARDYLAIPGTSVPIEEKFSLADELITTKRNRLLPETINEVTCLNSWLKIDEFNEKKRISFRFIA